MPDKLATLQEKRATEAAKIHELRELFNKNNQAWPDEAKRGEWDKVNKDYSATLSEIETVRHALDVNKRADEIREYDERQQRDERDGRRRPGQDDPTDRRDGKGRRVPSAERTAPSAEDQVLALQTWLRAGKNSSRKTTARHREACQRAKVDPRNPAMRFKLTTRFDSSAPAWRCNGKQELRTGLDVATSGAGMETIPQGFMPEFERRLLAFGGPRNVCRVIRTASGNSMPWPTVNDTANTGALLAEATTIGSSVDPTTAAVTFLAYKYSSKPILISQELLEDSAFNLAIEIASLLGERLGRIMGLHNTTGDNSSKPKGIVTDATAAVTAASATAVAADELLALLHSLDPAYRSDPSCGWMMNDNIILFLRKLKDANGQYLWQPGLQANVADRLLGFPVTTNQHMASAMTTAQKIILFGAFNKYVIRDVSSLRFYRLDERYRDTDQTAFVCFQRMDSRAIQSVALRLLTLG